MPDLRTCAQYCIAAALIAVAIGGSVSARAQDRAPEVDAGVYPNRPIHIVVPFPAGGPTDILSRIVAKEMTASWGQPVVVENRPGADTAIGAEVVAKADPDGYTVLVHSSSYTITPSTYPNAPYDTLRDLTGITPLAFLPQVVVISPGSAFPRCRISCAPRRQSRVR